MTQYDHQRVRLAVQFLVDSPYFSQHVKKLHTLVKRPRALPFKDDAEPLNELLVMGRQDLQDMEKMIALTEHKRSDRNQYQAQFMAAKRARQRKIIKLEEMLAGRTLTVDARHKVLVRQSTIWEREKGQYLSRRAAERKTETGKAPTWLEK